MTARSAGTTPATAGLYEGFYRRHDRYRARTRRSSRTPRSRRGCACSTSPRAPGGPARRCCRSSATTGAWCASSRRARCARPAQSAFVIRASPGSRRFPERRRDVRSHRLRRRYLAAPSARAGARTTAIVACAGRRARLQHPRAVPVRARPAWRRARSTIARAPRRRRAPTIPMVADLGAWNHLPPVTPRSRGE